MSVETRYFRVGLFVLGGIVLVVAGALLLGARSLFEKTVLYETYFDESVGGLEVGSAVKYRGVKIGTVESIGMVDGAYELTDPDELLRGGQLVRVVMETEQPSESGRSSLDEEHELREAIERGLRVRIASQGITGVSYLQADYVDPATHPPPEISWEPKYVYVPSAPSTMKTLSTAAERIFGKLEKARIEEVVAHLDDLVVTLDEKAEAIDVVAVQNEVIAFLQDFRATSAAVRGRLDEAEVPAAVASARQALDELTLTLVKVQQVVDGSSYDVAASLENVRVATENLRDLTETAKKYPSLVILGEPPPRIKAVNP